MTDRPSHTVLPTDTQNRALKPVAINRWMQRIHPHIEAAHMESMRALLAAVDAKDRYTRSHSLNVAKYAVEIGRRLRLPEPALDTLEVASLLHDLGKIGVADAILNKPGPLTKEEFEAIKKHPQTAIDILGHMSFLSDHRPIILHHHERFDGTGYPAGLSGDEIPIGARALAVADALDTMLSPRTYKRAFTTNHVRRELRHCAGHQFDPTIVNLTLRWLDEKPPRGGKMM
ncbi:MAG: HD-GYP domain-containing protein [Planctomycetes bacterium]|nr:HD-GYP domain-containing protein [Planctomycetota bacterium]MBI3834892.1 HD-GYP domain-containing protein [Planctomycetota bacterium]